MNGRLSILVFQVNTEPALLVVLRYLEVFDETLIAQNFYNPDFHLGIRDIHLGVLCLNGVSNSCK